MTSIYNVRHASYRYLSGIYNLVLMPKLS